MSISYVFKIAYYALEQCVLQGFAYYAQIMLHIRTYVSQNAPQIQHSFLLNHKIMSISCLNLFIFLQFRLSG